jgi:prepilin-type N-terminal cleavage/methylation domain-containing protein
MNPIMKPHKSRGFTLLELVLCIVLISIFAVIGSKIISNSFSIANYSDGENQSFVESTYALERLSNEIREINYPSIGVGSCITKQYCILSPAVFPAPPTSYSISAGNSFDFYKGSNNAHIVINIANGTTLQLNSIPLLKNVIALNLTFYDSTLSNSAPNNSNLRYVIIVMTVKPPNVASYSLRTRVALRNLG